MEPANPIEKVQKHRMLWWLAALAIVGLGVHLSRIRFMDAEWLSRAGCLVVVLGIWSGLGGIIQERLLMGRLRLRRRLDIAHARRKLLARHLDAETVEGELGEIEKRFEESAALLIQHLRMSLGILEFSLLISGTLLWGFGDLCFAG